MATKKRAKGRSAKGQPREINMTDLEALRGRGSAETDGNRDVHAAGTPGGGSAVGGLAGTNIDDGSPNNADLEDALGSGVRDTAGEEESGPAYGGHAGGAVGGTPAEGRAAGGHVRHGLAPGSARRGDSTVGADPDR